MPAFVRTDWSLLFNQTPEDVTSAFAAYDRAQISMRKSRSSSEEGGSSGEEYAAKEEIGAIAAHVAMNGVKHKPNLMSIVSGIQRGATPPISEPISEEKATGRPMLIKLLKPEPSKNPLPIGVANDGFELRLSAGSGGKTSNGGDGGHSSQSFFDSGAVTGGNQRRQDYNNDTNIAAMLVELRTPREGDVTMTKRGKSNPASPSKASRRKKVARRMSSTKFDGGDGTQVVKPCTCKKSRCLKLYCDCFAASILCSSDCKCNECKNNEDAGLDRKVAIQQLLKRNPNAFKSRKQVAQEAGCNCKKSGCIKKYCECFNAGLPCGEKCKCLGCQNCKENVNSPNSETSMSPSSLRGNHGREISMGNAISKMMELDSKNLTAHTSSLLSTENGTNVVITPTAMADVTADQQALQAVHVVAHAAVQALEKRQAGVIYSSNKRPTPSPSR
jgi:hypothetical protein